MQQKKALVRKTALAVVGGILAAALVVGSAAISSALHRQTPVFVQVTDVVGDVGTSASWTPERTAFEALGDVVGNCSTGWQIFRFDLTLRVNAGLPGLTQITFGPFNARHPTVSRGGDIAFEADGGLCGYAANQCENPQPVTGRQVFVYRPDTGKILQVTHGPGDMVAPSLSGRGRHVVFHSTSDLLGGGAPFPVPELYRGTLTRINSVNCPALPCQGSPPDRGLERLTTGGGQNGWLNFNAGVVAFESSGDLANGGANPGVQQIYRLKDGILQQVTSDPALPSRDPNLNKSGRVVSFAQDRPNPSGPGTYSQVFVAAFKKKGTLLTQVTRGFGDSTQPSLDPNGRRVAFKSAADLLLKGTPPNQIYIYDIRRTLLTQITGGPTGGDLPEATTGVIMSLVSQDDLTGTGNSTRQLFVANFFRNAPFTFQSPFPGTPTPLPTPTSTPIAGVPVEVSLALLTDEAAPNGNNTLTTVMAATVLDYYGNPVPDQTFVDFNIDPPTNGAIISDGHTNVDPTCDVSVFESETGMQVVNQPGVAHACVTYPGAEVGTTRMISAIVNSGQLACVGGANAGAFCNDPSICPGGACIVVGDSGVFTLPPAVNHCEFNGGACTDHNPCTIGDVCGGGTTDRRCVGGINAGAACTSTSECFGGQCLLTNPPSCLSGPPITCPDDGNPCTVDACNEFNGLCHQPVQCDDDGNPCTEDVCDASANGVCGVNKPPAQCVGGANIGAACTNTSECPGGECVLNSCDDGMPCTEDDACGGGTTARTCVSGTNAGAPCTSPSECPGGGACLLSAAATCQSGPVVTCPDDFNPCTTDSCDPATGNCGIPVVPCVCPTPGP